MRITKTIEHAFQVERESLPLWQHDTAWFRVERVTERLTFTAGEGKDGVTYTVQLSGHGVEDWVKHRVLMVTVPLEPDLSNAPAELADMLLGHQLAGIPSLP